MTSRLRPIAVVVFAALVAACITTFGLSVEALVDSLACAVLVAVTVTDFERRIVPNRIIVPALVVALVVQTFAIRRSSGSSLRSRPAGSS